LVPRDSCARLRVLPIGVMIDGKTRVLRVAMADPTDTAAILELEVIANCEIEVTALPLSAIEELVDIGYKQFSTAITRVPSRSMGNNLSISGKRTPPIEGGDGDKEVSVTAQIPLSALLPPSADLEQRFTALVLVLQQKGLVSEAELAEALRKLDGKPSES
jgi:hypothetical protein